MNKMIFFICFIFIFWACTFEYENKNFIIRNFCGAGEINYINEKMNFSTKFIDENEFFLDLKKNMPSPVLFIGENKKKSGAIYPFSMELKEEDYFAAEILLSLIRNSSNNREEIEYFIRHFNWERFMDECRKIEDKSSLNREKILLKISEGKFRKSDLK